MSSSAEESPTFSEIPDAYPEQESVSYVFTPGTISRESVVTPILFDDSDLKPLEGLPLEVKRVHYDKENDIDMVDVEISLIERLLRETGKTDVANVWRGVYIVIAGNRDYSTFQKTVGFLTAQGVLSKNVKEATETNEVAPDAA